MSVQTGVTNNQQGFTKTAEKRIDIDMGDNQHRIVAGTIVKKVHWIPVAIEKKDSDGKGTGEYKNISIPIVCGGDSLLDKIAKAETENIMESNIKTQLGERILQLYVVVNRMNRVIGYVEYTWSIEKALRDISKMKNAEQQIVWGKIGTWDHITNKSKSEGGRISYSTQATEKKDLSAEEMAVIGEAVAFKNQESDCSCFIKCDKFCDKCSKQVTDNTINLYEVARPQSEDELKKTFNRIPFNVDDKKVRCKDIVKKILDENGIAYQHEGKFYNVVVEEPKQEQEATGGTPQTEPSPQAQTQAVQQGPLSVEGEGSQGAPIINQPPSEVQQGPPAEDQAPIEHKQTGNDPGYDGLPF